jgi:hypothetical protein
MTSVRGIVAPIASSSRHVQERPAREQRRRERRELVVVLRHEPEEFLLYQVFVLPERGVQVGEDDALVLQPVVHPLERRLGVVLHEQGGVLLALPDKFLNGVRQVVFARRVRAR